MKLAPIALFVYNRPTHTKKVLDALSKNVEALYSDLHIFIDEPRQDATELMLQKSLEVRNIINKESRFKNIFIHESIHNKGLSKSIISGVTKILNENNSVIVLEDDIVPSLGFLNYMNTALNLYRDDKQVGAIHAWNYPIKMKNYKKNTFFLKGTDCWGWATWNDRWNLFQPDSSYLLDKIIERNLIYTFNRRDTYDYLSMLKLQIEGKIDSWAIRWDASMLLNDKYCLHPVTSLVTNIGFDGSGNHNEVSNIKQPIVEHIEIEKIPIVDNDIFYSSYYNYITPSYIKKIIIKLKVFLKKSLENF